MYVFCIFLNILGYILFQQFILNIHIICKHILTLWPICDGVYKALFLSMQEYNKTYKIIWKGTIDVIMAFLILMYLWNNYNHEY